MLYNGTILHRVVAVEILIKYCQSTSWRNSFEVCSELTMALFSSRSEALLKAIFFQIRAGHIFSGISASNSDDAWSGKQYVSIS
jgi:hypothetical protein